jgi:hypothetical protein
MLNVKDLEATKIEDRAWQSVASAPVVGMGELYFFGIIDILTKYDAGKRLAGFFKTLKYDREQLSTVDPDFYARRFLNMADKAVVIPPF